MIALGIKLFSTIHFLSQLGLLKLVLLMLQRKCYLYKIVSFINSRNNVPFMQNSNGGGSYLHSYEILYKQ